MLKTEKHENNRWKTRLITGSVKWKADPAIHVTHNVLIDMQAHSVISLIR